MVWGLGRRYNDYDITNTPTLAFDPAHRTLELTNVFAQDTIALGSEVKLTAGLKFEENSYSGWSTLPDLRHRVVAGRQHAGVGFGGARHPLADAARCRRARKVPDGVTVLSSRAIRTSSTEKVDAFELGYRSQPHVGDLLVAERRSTTSTTTCAPSSPRRADSCRCAGAT